MYLDVERSPFSERVFEIMDMDHSNSVNFLEFFYSYWSFCSLTKQGLCEYIFSMFEREEDGRGVLG